MDLSDLRKEIDDIDEALIPILLKRMVLSEQVAAYKQQHGIPVLDAQREQEILARVAACCGDKGEAIKTIFSAVMEASRTVQHQMLSGSAPPEPSVAGNDKK